MTAKSGGELVRRELETELSPQQFEALWPATEGRRIVKTRRVVEADQGLRIEFDEYAGQLAGLRVAEVEFPDEQTARAFTAPAWFGAEVTDREDYKNRRLALAGRPAPDG